MLRLSRRARRDLQRFMPADREHVASALRELELSPQPPNLDIARLSGRPPWLRLRVRSFRILFREIDGDLLVERIVDRRDLSSAIRTLD